MPPKVTKLHCQMCFENKIRTFMIYMFSFNLGAKVVDVHFCPICDRKKG